MCVSVVMTMFYIIYYIKKFYNTHKKWVRKCCKRATYRHNLRILYQGREDNPLHTDVFNELIENLEEKNPTWSKTTHIYDRPVTRSLFMGENSDIDDR